MFPQRTTTQITLIRCGVSGPSRTDAGCMDRRMVTADSQSGLISGRDLPLVPGDHGGRMSRQITATRHKARPLVTPAPCEGLHTLVCEGSSHPAMGRQVMAQRRFALRNWTARHAGSPLAHPGSDSQVCHGARQTAEPRPPRRSVLPRSSTCVSACRCVPKRHRLCAVDITPATEVVAPWGGAKVPAGWERRSRPQREHRLWAQVPGEAMVVVEGKPG